MNNIYKVIWSKAKNCYVVASEIARSHTKSATGSEKIGGVTRHSLLASLMALSLLCGGLGVASATDVVHVDENATGAVEVYTKTGVDTELGKKADKTAVEEIKNTVGDVDSGLVKKTADNATGIEVNRTNINTLEGRVGDVEGKVTTLEGKVGDASSGLVKDVATLKTTVGDASSGLVKDVTALETTVGDASSGLVKDVNDLRNQGNNLNTALGNKADQRDLDAANEKITNLETRTGNLSTDGKSLTGMDAVSGTTVSGDTVNAGSLNVTGEISNGNGVTTTLEKINASMEKTNQNADKVADLEKKTSKIDYDAANDKTTINGVGISNTQVDMGGKDITNARSLTATGKVTGDGVDAGTGAITGGSLTVTGKVTGNGVDAGAGDITTTGNVKGGTLETTGNATIGGTLSATGKVTGDGVDAGTGAITGGSLTVTGKVTGNGVDAGAGDITTTGNVKGGTLETTGNASIGGALTATGKVTGDGVDAGTGAITGGSLTVTGKVTGNGVDAGAGDITTTGNVKGGTLETTGNATIGGALTATGKVTGDGVDAGTGDITGGSLTVTGKVTGNGVDAGAGDITTTGNVKGGTLETTGDAKIGGDLTVNGKLNVDEISMKNDRLDPNGDQHHSATTITADGISNNAKVTDKNGVTTESKFTHDKEGSTTYAKKSDATNWKESTSNVTADGVSNKMTDSAGNTHTYYQTAAETKEQLVNGDKSNFEKKTAEGNTISIKDKDADGNKKSLTNTQTVDEEKTSVTNKDSSSTIKQGADQIRHNVTSADGKKSSIEVKAEGITNTSKDGTITNDAKDIVNNATGDMTNNVGGKLTTTVNGAAEETYKSGLKTDITGDETHTVTGKQTNTVKGGQENNISGGQKNNILTGNQETTVSDGSIINKAENGDISNTAKNVTNEGTVSVTNKVGTNEVKVSQDGVDINVDADKTIKESVGADTSRTMTDGNIIDKAGDMTVTTDKTTGTTFGNGTPNDTTVINGGTIGTNKVNANETNTKKLTAGADDGADGGRLTVDANDGVKGSYKSGDYTSRSYILANTLKSGVDNGKEPTDTDFVGSRTDHYMEGDKAKLDETVKDAAGSNVTTKTSTSSKSEIQSADTITSVQQTENMVQSYVGKKDGSVTNVTTNFANASANQVTENGQTSTVLNNKDGLLIQNNANGNSFTTADGTNTGPALEWTNIKGNEISTGKVEANYVKMGYADVMKDLGVRGNAKIDGKTTTGSLEVTGTSTLKGNVTMENNATVGNDLTVKGITNTKTLNVTEDAKVGRNLSVDGNATIKGDVTARSYQVDGKTYIDANGIHANGQKITDVADGSISEGSKDAVNGGQLYNVKNDLEGKVNKVGANAAAMANLHPMEFDPDSKWNIAAAIGNYGSETAAALGAFYRPNDDVMVNLSTAFGTGENMVGGGVSVRLGKGGNKLSREESNALKDQVNDLTARMDALLSVLNPNMSKDFPDVPENHWAYEAVSRLAGNDIVQGYPDGEFHGERTMTRYEMAEIIYNALSRGAEAERELVEEFKPELQAMAASEKATAEKAEG